MAFSRDAFSLGAVYSTMTALLTEFHVISDSSVCLPFTIDFDFIPTGTGRAAAAAILQ